MNTTSPIRRSSSLGRFCDILNSLRHRSSHLWLEVLGADHHALKQP